MNPKKLNPSTRELAVSANHWLKLIGGTREVKVPDGFSTAQQIQEQTGFSQTTVFNRLRSLKEQGRVEVKKFRSKSGCQEIPHYRIIQDGGKTERAY